MAETSYQQRTETVRRELFNLISKLYNIYDRVSIRSKHSVYIQSLGGPPFAQIRTKRGYVIVSHGYTVIAFGNGRYWLGEVKVEPDPPIAYYRFTDCLSRTAENEGEERKWYLNATYAYKANLDQEHNFVVSGHFLLGMMYPPVQDRLMKLYPEITLQLETLSTSDMEYQKQKERKDQQARLIRQQRRRKRKRDLALEQQDSEILCQLFPPEQI